jgi:hypothetical protein
MAGKMNDLKNMNQNPTHRGCERFEKQLINGSQNGGWDSLPD